MECQGFLIPKENLLKMIFGFVNYSIEYFVSLIIKLRINLSLNILQICLYFQGKAKVVIYHLGLLSIRGLSIRYHVISWEILMVVKEVSLIQIFRPQKWHK